MLSFNNLPLSPRWGDYCVWIFHQEIKLDPPLQYLHLHRLSTILDSEDEEQYDDEAVQWVHWLLFSLILISWSACFGGDKVTGWFRKKTNISAACESRLTTHWQKLSKFWIRTDKTENYYSSWCILRLMLAGYFLISIRKYYLLLKTV